MDALVNALCVPTGRRHAGCMWTLLIVLLVLWLGMSVLGFVVKGLLWLAVLGIVLFLATLVFGFVRKGRTDT